MEERTIHDSDSRLWLPTHKLFISKHPLRSSALSLEYKTWTYPQSSKVLTWDWTYRFVMRVDSLVVHVRDGSRRR